MSSAQGQVGEYRTVYINPISADDIKNVKLFSKMDVYVQASIAGYPRSTQTSSLDKNCGTHPRWRNGGRPMELVVDEPYLTRPGLSIRFDIKATSSLGTDKEVGHVTVPIHDLFSSGGGSQEKVVEYQVLTPSGRPQGSFKFSYRFGDKYQKPKAAENSSEPVTAYPAYPASQSGGGYDKKQQQQHGYPPQQHQQPAYPFASASYPPQQAGYGGYGGGYPPQMSGYGGGYGYPQPPRRNSRMGGGMGLGLGAGLLGGLLVGDMISDASDYGDGYSDAMGDMGGGDMGGDF